MCGLPWRVTGRPWYGLPVSAAKPATPLAALAGVRPSAEYLPELESLRGIAIVLVYAFHVDGVVLFPWNAGGRELSPALAFVRAGHTGVDLALLGLLTALGYLLRWAVMFREPFDRPPDHVWHLPEAVLWSLVLLLLLCAPLRSKWLFSNALLARLGILSYSIYMIHLPLTWLFLGTLRTAGVAGPYGLYGWSWRTTLVVVVETVTCLGLAALTYRVIERPFLTRKARLGA